MKAWLSYEPGGPETLRLGEVSPPSAAGYGEILVSVEACGLNYPDLLFMRDAYQAKTQRPFIPGSELCGIVEAIGPGVDHVAPGDRVVGVCEAGGLAERVVLAATNSYRVPAGLTPQVAAGLIFTYGTSFYALFGRGAMRSGERVLVLGAGGGVGLAMTELAANAGGDVTAAASDEAKLALARAKGARSTVAYPRDIQDAAAAKDFAQALKDCATKQGFDIVVDPVGGAYCEPALRSIGWGGRYLVIGFPAGIPRPPLNLALLKGCSIVGVDWYQHGRREPGERAEEIGKLFELVLTGRIDPTPAQVVPFESAPDALALLNSRSLAGKVVVSAAI